MFPSDSSMFAAFCAAPDETVIKTSRRTNLGLLVVSLPVLAFLCTLLNMGAFDAVDQTLLITARLRLHASRMFSADLRGPVYLLALPCGILRVCVRVFVLGSLREGKKGTD